MVKYSYGGRTGRRFTLAESDAYVAVRTRDRQALGATRAFDVTGVSADSRRLLQDFQIQARFAEAGVEVWRATVPRGQRALRDKARKMLKKERDVEFAGRVFMDKAGRPVLYTENLFVKFDGDAKASACLRLLRAQGLTVKRELEYARNAFFVAAPKNTGQKTFDIAEKLLNEKSVELCHPELIRESRQRAASPMQWHLRRTVINGNTVDAHASVEPAWELSTGAGIIIAVIDDGVDIDHEEFRSAGKIVAPRDVTRDTDDPRPTTGSNHGTACAGVACAAGSVGASGVAPSARLMPIRLRSALGSQDEAEAFVWAARNGADIISCSWGPADGDFTNLNDPAHTELVALPDSTRLAMDFAVNNGRGGKGCVILFAAGNGNESVENDGYASYPKVIAVAATDDINRKAPYSDFGDAVWCAFPSNHFFPSVTKGIWTTDRTGAAGYNSGNTLRGDAAGNYTNSFGGTSSACPGAAGVAALILARNPVLRWDEVRDIMKRCGDRIDPNGGRYDVNGHSPFYGYGRLNARRAVELAMPPQPVPTVVRTITQDVPIRDLTTSRLLLAIADKTLIQSFKVRVDLEHTYIGDLVVKLRPPTALGVAPITLHNREGGSTDNLHKTYDDVSTPALAALRGKSPAGSWTLEVADREAADTGMIKSFSVEMTLGASGPRAIRPASLGASPALAKRRRSVMRRLRDA